MKVEDGVATFEYAPNSNRLRILKVIFGPLDKNNKILFYFHHDIWSNNDNSKEIPFLKEIASHGFTIIAPALIPGKIGGLKGMMEDVRYALDWTESNLDYLQKGRKDFAFVGSGFGAQLALLSSSSNYSPLFRNLFEFTDKKYPLKGLALISPITDINDLFSPSNTTGKNIAWRKEILTYEYGPNYESSNLYKLTSSSKEYSRTLVACKAKILVQFFNDDPLVSNNMRILDNLRLLGGRPLFYGYDIKGYSLEGLLNDFRKEEFKKPIKDLVEYVGNLWSYD